MKRIVLPLLLLTACTRPQHEIFQPKPVESPEYIKEVVRDGTAVHGTAVVKHNGDKVIIKEESYSEESINYFEDLQIKYNFMKQNEMSDKIRPAADQLASIYTNSSFVGRQKFSETPYADMFIATAKPEFLRATKDLYDLFDKQKVIIMNSIYAADAKIPAPNGPISLSVAVKYLTDLLSSFETYIKSSKNLNPKVRDGIVNAFYERFWTKLPLAQQKIQQFEQSQQLDQAADELLSFLSSFEIEMTEDEIAQLDQARRLGHDLNRPLTEKETLSMLIDIWEGMTPEEREESFATVSPDLHEYLSSKSENSRECLKQRKCKKIFLSLARKWFILPEIKKTGVDKIQAQIQSAAFAELNAKIGTAAADAIKGIKERVYAEISSELDKEYQKYVNIRNNFDAFARNELQRWFEETYGRSTLPALESASLVPAGQFKAKLKSDTLTFDPKILGDALVTTDLLFQSKSVDKELLALTKVNQMLAHAGFTKVDGSNSSSLARVRGQKPGFINIEKSVEIPGHIAYYSGAAPQGFTAFSSKISPSMTNAQMNSLLAGFRSMIEFFADWKDSPWKKIVRDIKAKDMLASLESDDLDQNPLPQDGMLALAVGNYSIFLAHLDSLGSPLFFHCPEGKNAWLSEGTTCEKKTSFVSLNADRSTAVINTRDHADFLIEITQLHKLIGEIGNTKTKYLTERKSGKDSAVTRLQSSKKSIEDLTVGLANFLASVLGNDLGRFATTYHIGDRKANFDKISLQTSLKSIKALSLAGKVLNAHVYKKAALQSFKYLELSLLDQKSGFFRESNASPSLASRILALEVLNIVSDFAETPEDKNHFQSLKETWTDKVKSAF